MVRCLRCVMPTTRPDTAFVDGVCSACLSFGKRAAVNWDERKKELLALLDKHGGRCIVPSSGGKDSTYQVLTLLELGADVTVITATTCHLTPIGRRNIDNLARFARTIEVTPNRTVRAKLNRLALEMVGDCSWPEHVSIHRLPFKLAKPLGISLIFYGECPNEAYGGPLGTETTHKMTQRWVSEFGGFLGLRAQDFVGIDGITEKDMADYTAPSDSELSADGIEAHFLGQYVFWDSHRNARVAAEAGMRQELPGPMNFWNAENQDNYQVAIHDFLGWLKFGYGRLCAQISVDIRAGHITRDEAMNLVRERDGLFPESYLGKPLQEILAHIHVTPEKFISVCNAFTNFSLFAESKLEWGRHLTLREFV